MVKNSYVLSNDVRYQSIDLIKWLAIITMFIDHLRYVFPSYEFECLAIGRWAFVMFALALGFNMNQIFLNKKYDSLITYFVLLIVFSIISEIPYQLLSGEHALGTYNIMFTLMLGVLAIGAFNSIKIHGFNIFLLLSVLYGCLLINSQIQYGVLGVLLMLFFYLTFNTQNIYKRYVFAVIAVLLACLCNLQYSIPVIIYDDFLGNAWVMAMFLGSLSGALLGLFLVLGNLNIKSGKVGKWAWWFYPVHQLFLYLLSLGLVYWK